MTDPTTLTNEQLCRYVRQLQQTVMFWQRQFAHAKGFDSREAMIEHLPNRATDTTARCGWVRNLARDLVDADWLA